MAKVKVSLSEKQENAAQADVLREKIAAELSQIDNELTQLENVTTLANVRTALAIILRRQRKIVRVLGHLTK